MIADDDRPVRRTLSAPDAKHRDVLVEHRGEMLDVIPHLGHPPAGYRCTTSARRHNFAQREGPVRKTVSGNRAIKSDGDGLAIGFENRGISKLLQRWCKARVDKPG